MASIGLAVREGLRLWEADKFEDETRDYQRLQRQADAIKLNAMIEDPNYLNSIMSTWEKDLTGNELTTAENRAAMAGVADAALAVRLKDQADIHSSELDASQWKVTDATRRLKDSTDQAIARGLAARTPFVNAGLLADAQRLASQSQFLLGIEPTNQEKQRYEALLGASNAQFDFSQAPILQQAATATNLANAVGAQGALDRAGLVQDALMYDAMTGSARAQNTYLNLPTEFNIGAMQGEATLAQLVFDAGMRPTTQSTQEYNLKTEEANAKAGFARADLANQVLDLTLKSQEGSLLNTIFDNETLATTEDDRRKLAQAQALFSRIDAEYQLTRQEQQQLMQNILDRVGYRTAKFTLGQLGIKQNIERSNNVMAYKDAVFARDTQAMKQAIQKSAMQLQEIQTRVQLKIAQAKEAGKALKSVYTPDEMKKVEESLYILSMNSAGIYMDKTTGAPMSSTTGKEATEDQIRKFRYAYDYGMKAATEGQSMQVISSGPQAYDLNMQRIAAAQKAEADRKRAASGIPKITRNPIQGYGVGVISPTGGTNLMINPAFGAPQLGVPLQPSH